MNTVSVDTIDQAAKTIKGVVKKTPLERIERLSDQYHANIYVKREDLQKVRSYKIRGAYNLMSSLTAEEKKRGVVAASAGNHAQGVAVAAAKLKIRATIFMPVVTPLQKINKVKRFGGSWVEIKLEGKTYDEASGLAHVYCDQSKGVYVPAFDDERVIAGQGTVGREIHDELDNTVDVVLAPVGGGGLIAGIATYLKTKNKKMKVIGVQSKGAPGMSESLKAGHVVTLKSIDTFVDGTAVKTVGTKTFAIAQKLVDSVTIVDEGAVCTTMIELYQSEGIIAEPAGALAIAALEEIKDDIAGKTVVCILSGGNNDILRYPEVMERSLVYKGLKHYFLINFAQKPGQLRQFVDKALGPTDDIVRFEYIKKSSKEMGPALIGVEVAKKEDFPALLKRMEEIGINYTLITTSDLLYHYLI